MAALNTDLLKKLSRKWVGQIGSAGVGDDTTTTIALSSTTDLATDTAVVATIDRVDANGKKTPTLEESVVGVVSGTNLVTCTRGVEGTAQAHAAGAVVEILVTAKGYNDIIDAILEEHSQLGVHDTTKVVDLTTAQTLTNKTLTSPVINTGLSGTAKATATEVATGTEDAKFTTPLAVAPYANNSLYRQAIINGNFDVWQRGTSIINVVGVRTYTADRWYMMRSANKIASTASRQDGTGVAGSVYSLRVQRDSGNADTAVVYTGQSLETKDVVKFRGKSITLSFWAKCGADYSEANSYLVSNIITGTGTDENPYTGFTGQATEKEQNNVLTTSWQKFTMTSTAAIGATINELLFRFNFTPVGTASTNDWFEITQVQVCAGSVALPFMPKSYEDELRACQRYYVKFGTNSVYNPLAIGQAISTTAARVPVSFPVTMRTNPTLTTAGNLALTQANNTLQAVTSQSITSTAEGAGITLLTVGVAANLVAGNATYLTANNDATAYIAFSSEL